MNALNLVYYSPTGTTKKIVKEIAQCLDLKLSSENNLAEPINQPKTDSNSLTIFGLPVYGGRLPLAAIEALNRCQASHSPAVIIAVYGNREFEDALLELKDIVSKNGFNVIAGAAFIGEHSFSSASKPIAHARPDKQDLNKCRDFAQMIAQKLSNTSNIDTASAPNIPGNHPYKDRKPLPPAEHPTTIADKCDKCGICVELCPTNAITLEQTAITNGELCTWCNACVKGCPNEARLFDSPNLMAIQDRLFTNCSERKEPEYFM